MTETIVELRIRELDNVPFTWAGVARTDRGRILTAVSGTEANVRRLLQRKLIRQAK